MSKRSSLRKLNLTETKLQEKGYVRLLDCLTDFLVLRTLVLDNNYFLSEETLSLSSFIKDSKIQTFSVNYCGLGDLTGQAIGAAIEYSNSIKEIRARENDFMDKTAMKFALSLESASTI